MTKGVPIREASSVAVPLADGGGARVQQRAARIAREGYAAARNRPQTKDSIQSVSSVEATGTM